jgi:hypothetical protein
MHSGFSWYPGSPYPKSNLLDRWSFVIYIANFLIREERNGVTDSGTVERTVNDDFFVKR